ncbi:MAG: tetratricopeptide repeat protein [Peristeroidobacter soli]
MRLVRLKAVTGAALILSAALLAGGCDFFKGTDDRLARAEASLTRGEYDVAMVELKNVLADQPGDPRAHLLVARASLQLGNLDAAWKALDDAASANADARALKTLRAQVLLRGGKIKELQDLLDSGDPQPDNVATLRARLLAARNQCAAAIPQARKAMTGGSADNPAAQVIVAECYHRFGDTARALKELEVATAASPTNAEAWMALGRTQQLLGQKEEAEKSFSTASTHAAGQLGVPEQANLYLALADLQIARNDTPALRATYRKMLDVAPQTVVTQWLGARLSLMEGKLDESLATLRRLVVDAPQIGSVRVLLTSAYLSQGSLEQAGQELAWLEQNAPPLVQEKIARPSFDALIAAKPDTEEYWILAGAVNSALGLFDQSRVALAKADKIAPHSLRVAGGMARLELRAGNPDRALELAADLATKFPQDPAVIALRVDALVAAGKPAEADALLQAISSKATNSALAISQHRLRVAGKLPQVNQPLESWLASHPKDLSVRALLAESLRTSGDTTGAVAEYEKLMVDAKESPVVLNNLAWLYHLQGDPRALATAKRAWELAPKSSEVADTYGWLLVESGSVPEGAKILAAADSAAGVARTEVRYHYVQALARQGEKDRARALLQELLAEKPAVPSEAEATQLLASLGDDKTT